MQKYMNGLNEMALKTMKQLCNTVTMVEITTEKIQKFVVVLTKQRREWYYDNQRIVRVEVENNVADYDIAVQYRDSGGFYSGEDTMIELDINKARKEVVL